MFSDVACPNEEFKICRYMVVINPVPAYPKLRDQRVRLAVLVLICRPSLQDARMKLIALRTSIVFKSEPRSRVISYETTDSSM